MQKASHISSATGRYKGNGWYSFDHRGVHFVGLEMSPTWKAVGMVSARATTTGVLEDDLKARSATPRLCSAQHSAVPSIPDWGWGTDTRTSFVLHHDSFPLPVLNGPYSHIIHKVEGKKGFFFFRSQNRDFDGFSTTHIRNSSLGRTHEGASRPLREFGYHRCELSGQFVAVSRNRRFAARGLRSSASGMARTCGS